MRTLALIFVSPTQRAEELKRRAEADLELAKQKADQQRRESRDQGQGGWELAASVQQGGQQPDPKKTEEEMIVDDTKSSLEAALLGAEGSDDEGPGRPAKDEGGEPPKSAVARTSQPLEGKLKDLLRDDRRDRRREQERSRQDWNY